MCSCPGLLDVLARESILIHATIIFSYIKTYNFSSSKMEISFMPLSCAQKAQRKKYLWFVVFKEKVIEFHLWLLLVTV